MNSGLAVPHTSFKAAASLLTYLVVLQNKVLKMVRHKTRLKQL